MHVHLDEEKSFDNFCNVFGLMSKKYVTSQSLSLSNVHGDRVVKMILNKPGYASQ